MERTWEATSLRTSCSLDPVSSLQLLPSKAAAAVERPNKTPSNQSGLCVPDEFVAGVGRELELFLIEIDSIGHGPSPSYQGPGVHPISSRSQVFGQPLGTDVPPEDLARPFLGTDVPPEDLARTSFGDRRPSTVYLST